jgi:hypothetical protein
MSLYSFSSAFSTVTKFLVPDWGDIVDYSHPRLYQNIQNTRTPLILLYCKLSFFYRKILNEKYMLGWGGGGFLNVSRKIYLEYQKRGTVQ